MEKLHFDKIKLAELNKFYRGNLINSLSGYKSATLIGTANEQGQTNLAIFSNIVHLGADPAMIGFINRPLEAAPHTLSNIQQTGLFSMSLIHTELVAQAHQTSAKYAIDCSEFDEVGLTPEWKEDIKVPFVKESRLQYLCELAEIIPIKQNNTFFVTATINALWVPAVALKQDGFIAHELIDTVCSLGIDGYYLPAKINRYTYAKADLNPQIID